MTEQRFLKRLYNTEEVAAMLGLSKQTIYNWRHNRKGPDYVMMGAKPMYEVVAIEQFIKNNRVEINGEA